MKVTLEFDNIEEALVAIQGSEYMEAVLSLDRRLRSLEQNNLSVSLDTVRSIIREEFNGLVFE